jgi:UDP-N-acetyl-D-mannosaminouronate:lipid I N-acetyl-D-mannosaminouronosyltransferase
MHRINNITVYPFKDDLEFLDYINGKKKILVALNSLKITNADEAVKTIVNDNIGYADGIGVVWALKWKGCRNVTKIPGCELWLKIIGRRHRDTSFYFIGGKQDVIERTVGKLEMECPGIQIDGFHNGFFDETEKAGIIQDIIEKRPGIIFVAMGSPKQELFMAELYSHYPALYQGLGGSLDVYVNHVKRAPQWIIDRNLEWAYRLFKQPGRFVRQLSLVKYVVYVILGIY